MSDGKRIGTGGKILIGCAGLLVLTGVTVMAGVYLVAMQVKKVATKTLDELPARLEEAAKAPPPVELGPGPEPAPKPPVPAGPPLEPDPPQLLFSSNRDGQAEIYLCNLNGDNLRNLSHHPAQDTSPAWSPDGLRVVFTSTRDGDKRQLFVMDVDGTNVTQLTRGGDESRTPAWSPDGKSIAFVRHVNGGNGQVFVMDANGENARNLTKHPSFSADPAWSPDGKRIAFTSDRGPNGFGLYVMDADGSNLKELPTRPNRMGSVYPAWSPDGKTIAFSGMLNTGFLIILAIDADGKNLRQVAREPSKNTFCTWSPDGKALAFANFQGPDSRVFMTDTSNWGALHPQLVRARVQHSATVHLDDGRIAWRPRVTVGRARLAAAEAEFARAEKASGDERRAAFTKVRQSYLQALPSFTDADKAKILERLTTALAAIDTEDAKHDRFGIYEGAWRVTEGRIQRDYLIQNNGEILITSATDDRTGWKGKALRKDGVVLFAWENDKTYERPKLELQTMRLERFRVEEYPTKLAGFSTAVYLGQEPPKEPLPAETAPGYAWERVESRDGQFVATFPGRRRFFRNPPRPTPGFGSETSIDPQGATYQISWKDHGNTIPGGGGRPDWGIAASLGELRSRDARSKKSLTIGGYPGLEYSKSPAEWHRLFVVRGREYSLSVYTRDGAALDEKKVQRFFASFTVNGATAVDKAPENKKD